jgi:putative oxidoreductase
MVQESLFKRVITSPYLAVAFRLYLGFIFLYASMYKISYTAEFAENIASYQILPHWGVNLFAIVMAWTELICGTLLVFGVRSKAAVLMIAGMLAMFTVAVSLSLMRGIPIGCGCFHSLEEPMTWTTLLRDLVWLAIARHVYLFDSVLQLERYFQLNIKDDPIE